ncbi:MAG: thiamine pyrophosphate-dependent enzyme, partial [Planctomycetota bacterium]
TVRSLPRFWDHAGVFYRAGRTEELVADPCLALGAVPPLTSSFRDVSAARTVLPVFDPAACDGDPALWMSCPDGSVAPLVIGARALVDAGIELAAADALRAVAGRLAKGMNKVAASADPPPTTAGALLEAAFAAIAGKMDEGRMAPLRAGLEAVVTAIGPLPLARTRVFFDEPERQSPGTGEFLALAVDPAACKCPELVLAAGAGHGLVAVEQSPETIEAARRLWSLLEQLPDTSGATIERVRRHPEIGPLAAIMLSRHCSRAAAGGDGAEPGSGAKLALRRVLALTEFHRQPRLQQHLEAIETLRGRLAERIRELLAAALPDSDLDSLAEGLELLGGGDVDLASISSRVDTAVTAGRVDGVRLARLVDAARGLADLRWRLEHGPDEQGRARFGLAVAPGAVSSWAGAFPYNPFPGPVVIDASGETAALARGLLEGQLRQAIAGIRMIRLARLELEGAAPAPDGLADLGYGDLADDERAICPPIVMVGDDLGLGGHGLSQLVWLLGSGLPVKIVVLAEQGGTADGGLAVDALGSFPAAGRGDLALLALLAGDAFVCQTSLAHEDHFARGVLDAMDFDGPALVIVHAPSPQRHGFAPARMLAQAALAVETRAAPLLVFDPRAAGVFGSRLDLAGNPAPSSALGADADGRVLAPPDWAATEARFADHLAPLADDDPRPTPAAEFLALPPDERAGRTPFVAVGGADGRRLRVAPPLVADADRRLRLWRTLQELAGVVTPFTAEVRAAAERELAAGHEAEIERLRREHETQVAALRAQYAEEATRRVTERLMALAGRAAATAEAVEENAS